MGISSKKVKNEKNQDVLVCGLYDAIVAFFEKKKLEIDNLRVWELA